MRQIIKTTGILAAAGLCAPAVAQDSVSNNLGGLPGDALNPYTDHCASYVIDLAEITTSKDNTFGMAPVIKLNKTSADFFNNLNSASTISPFTQTGTAYSRGSYSLWENLPGAGVNPQTNDTPGTVEPAGQASRFAVGIAEFGGSVYNGIVGAIVNYDPANPNRLYVDRRQAAVNGVGDPDEDVSQLGGLSIDADGNVYYRADSFGSTGIAGITTISDNNIFRTRLADRDCGVRNLISGDPGTSDASDLIVDANPTAHTVPNNIPASVAGGNGLYAGPNFNTQYVSGDVGSTVATTAHLDTTGGIGSDHRGAFGSTSFDFTGSGADYHFTVYSKDASGNTTVLNAFGVDAAGAVVDTAGFQVPLSITDNETGFGINYTSNYQFRNYVSQGAFRGGVGQVAIGGDQDGRGLMAATMNEFGFNDDFSNQIVVLRYDPVTGAEEWTLAAYVDVLNIGTPNAGKPISDENGDVIGQIVDLPAVTGGSPLGPGMSAPAIDSAGNIWFISAVEFFDRDFDGDGVPDGSDFDSALIRAVYDPATFSYELERVIELGTTVTGPNSGADYQINFLGTADANSQSSGTLYSSNVAQSAWNDSDISGVDPADPITNGGVFFGTSVTYDTNGDGIFNDPTAGNFDAGEPADEAYTVGMYIGYFQTETPCVGDLDGDGTVGFADLNAFVAAFQSGDPLGDLDDDGTVGFADLNTFVAAFQAGCP